MQLVITHTAYTDSVQIEQMLDSLGFHRVDLTSLKASYHQRRRRGGHGGQDKFAHVFAILECRSDGDSTYDALDELASAYLIGFHTPPMASPSVVEALKESSLQGVLSDWHESAIALANLIRLNRDRASLFNTEEVQLEPMRFHQRFQEFVGMTCPSSFISNWQSDPSIVPILYRALISHCISESAMLKSAWEEVNARSNPLLHDRGFVTVDCQAALEELDRTNRLTDSLKAESRLLLEQLDGVHEEVEEIYKDAEFAKHQERVLKEELDSLSVRTQNLESHNHDLKRKLDKARNDLEKMKQSKSWRVTAPLRTLKNRRAPKQRT